MPDLCLEILHRHHYLFQQPCIKKGRMRKLEHHRWVTVNRILWQYEPSDPPHVITHTSIPKLSLLHGQLIFLSFPTETLVKVYIASVFIPSYFSERSLLEKHWA